MALTAYLDALSQQYDTEIHHGDMAAAYDDFARASVLYIAALFPITL